MEVSALQKVRYGYRPALPACLQGEIGEIGLELGAAAKPQADQDEIRRLFPGLYGRETVKFAGKGKGTIYPETKKPLTIGAILSGGQAPGGHNVLAGLFDGLKKGNPGSRLLGFLGGPDGLVKNRTVEITEEMAGQYRNTGGFDMIGSGRTKIQTPEQFAGALATVEALGLDGVVVIGGDDSNTNAVSLAEYFLAKGSKVKVAGCPKTIDGDLKNEHIEVSFGFDTAAKTYSELIGNIARDANSAKKYWHFVKLMGRAASHIALECALQCRPNICLVSEEVEAKKLSLKDIVDEVCDSVVKRAEKGDNFGLALVPEGLIEFVPEMKTLIRELNDLLALKQDEFAALPSFPEQKAWLSGKIGAASWGLFDSLPPEIAVQFLADRDPHGNVQVSRIETERLLIGMVEKRLEELRAAGRYNGKFSALGHFFGYEGRSAFPTNFDASYCYALGYSTSILIAAGFTGCIASIRGLAGPAQDWTVSGIPLSAMLVMEIRGAKPTPVIKKALVDLEGAPFKAFAAGRGKWAVETCYRCPGAIQYFGPPEVCDAPSITLQLESGAKP
jgi:pyrophosphate--fructose-6-phosphate 1-phosphotransferase